MTGRPASLGAPPAGNLEAGIAIVGMACRFAGARSVERYWANLRDGVESVGTYADDELIAAGVDPALLRQPHYVRAGALIEDMECFDAGLFGLSRRDAAIMDPQHRHFLECAWEALEDAGHVPERFPGAIGVFGGSGYNAYLARNLLTNPRLVREVGAFLLRHTGNDKDFLTTRVSHLLDLKGPSVTVQTACSTSLVAVHMAVRSLLGGECDLALAGAVSIDLPHRHGYLYEEGEILSPDGHCRPFDASSRGTVFGDGVGIVVLRRLADALRDRDHIHAVIRGSAINNDGSGKAGYLAPGVDGQAEVVTEALRIAGVDAGTIGYVEAHGSGTPVGDPIEVAALTRAYRRDTAATGYCALGSVKANIGHTDTAAGLAGLIKVALALHHRTLPPSLNHSAPNPACDLARSPFAVNTALKPWRRGSTPRRAGVTALGVGGTNAHVVLEEAPRRAKTRAPRTHQLLTLSARSATALDANTAALAAHLAANPATALADAAYTLNLGRRALERRRIVVAEGAADAAAALTGRDRAFTGQALADRRVAFMFCGAGAQYAGMGTGLYADEPVFRAAVDAGLAEAEAAGCDALRRWLFPVPADEAEARHAMERPSVALPALFIVQVALAKLWMHWGVTPSGMIGHSSGEYAAAHLAGVIGLGDALRIVSTRGRLFETLPRGGMLSVPLPEADLRPLLTDGLSIAAVNGPSLCIVSGEVDAIARLDAALAAREIESQRVRIAVAAHSAMLDPVLDAFRACLATIRLSPPTLPFVSNLTGLWITPAEATDPEYWVRHLRQTVRFTDGLQQLFPNADLVLLEVGPGRTMASLARQHPGRARPQPVLNSLRHANEEGADLPQVLATLGRLWTLGVPIDWERYWAGERRRRVPLPTYRFDRERHWIDPGRVTLHEDPAPDAPLERRADVADWFFEPVWRRTPLPVTAVPDGPALVFEDRAGLGAAVAARLRAAGRPVATVRPGRRFARHDDAFTVDPTSAADYLRLIGLLAAEGRSPGQIYHCWLVTGPSWRGDAVREAPELQDRGLFSLLFLAQALAEEDMATTIRLAVVSDGMQRVSTERDVVPAKATVLGACRVAGRECANLAVRSIDVDLLCTVADRQRLADRLFAEVASGDDAEAVGYRAGERWVQTFEAAPRPAGGDAGLLRARGTYLITGGLGGLGLAVARHLAESHGARLALVARTALPPRNRWDEQLAARRAGDPIRERIAAVLAIEAAGGEVMVLDADVADVRAMRRAARRVRARFGPIHGVFHAAGARDDGALRLKRREGVAAVLAPKLYGTLALEAALVGDRPDFILLFSSVDAVAGPAGQVDDAAANAFLDAYAQSRHSGAGPRVVSVGWSRWQGVGDTHDPALPSGIVPREGLAAIDRVLGGDARPHLIVSPHELVPAIARLRAPAQAARVVPEAGHPDAPRTPAERTIAAMWGDMLGVEPVRRTDDFFDLGGHSLLAVQFLNRLRKRTGKALPLAALLETPTVERLAALIEPEGAASAACGTPPHPAADADHRTAAPDAITIRPGAGPPLFLIHDGLGETLLYRSLAMGLRPGRTVLGLEPGRDADGRFLDTSIRDMAAAYVARVRRVQPDGPYLLAGLCAGGVIAFEMARQLQDAGAVVPFIGILDAADVDAAPRSFYTIRRRWARIRDALGDRALIDAAPLLLRKAVNAARWEVGSRLERRRQARAVDRWRAPAPDRTAPDPSFLQLYEIAHRAYRPCGLFEGGDVVVFAATAGNGTEDDIPYAERYSDCILGWGKRVVDDVQLISIPGGHTSLLQEPHVATTARALQAALDSALARWGPPSPATAAGEHVVPAPLTVDAAR